LTDFLFFLPIILLIWGMYMLVMCYHNGNLRDSEGCLGGCAFGILGVIVISVFAVVLVALGWFNPVIPFVVCAITGGWLGNKIRIKGIDMDRW
jgi:hypothetical protein